MENNEWAKLLGELIEADEEDNASLEKLLKQHGVNGLFQQLNESMPLSSISLEKLIAIRQIVGSMVEGTESELKEEIGYGSTAYE